MKRGFIPILLSLTITIILLSSCASKESQKSMLPQTQEQKTEAKSASDTKQLLGWWEETDSWSLNFQTRQLEKNPSVLPFYREFTENYMCQIYDSKYHCTRNVPYTIDGNKIIYGSVSGYYEEWEIIDGKLELTKFQGSGSKAVAGSKSLHQRVSKPTSPNQKIGE